MNVIWTMVGVIGLLVMLPFTLSLMAFLVPFALIASAGWLGFHIIGYLWSKRS